MTDVDLWRYHLEMNSLGLARRNSQIFTFLAMCNNEKQEAEQ
jgi:hypothetical protein